MLKKIIKISVFFIIYINNAQKNEFKQICNIDCSTNIKIKKLDSLFLSVKNKDSLFFLKTQYAKWLYKNEKIKKAIQISKDALKIAKKTKDSTKIQEALFWIGKFYSKINLIKSNTYFKNSLALNNQNAISQKILYYLGKNYNTQNNYIKANEYFRSVIELQKKDKRYTSLTKFSYLQIANNLFYKKDSLSLAKAITIMKKLDSDFSFIPITLKQKYFFKTLTASLYNEETNLNINLAEKYYKQALKIASNLKDSIKITDAHIRLASLYNTSNYKKSLFYLNKIKPKTNDSITKNKLFFNYGLTYYYGKKYKKSIFAFKKATQYLIGNSISKNTLPSLKNLSIEKQNRLLFCLPFLAKTYHKYYLQTKNRELLEKSIFYYKVSDMLLDITKKKFQNFKSRLFWRKKSEKIYSRALDVCYLAKDKNTALFFMEKNKALLLSEDIATNNYKLSLNVDLDLIKKENIYKKRLNQIEYIRTYKDTLLQEKLNIEQKLLTFQDSIYKGKLQKEILFKHYNISDIQKNLKENEVFLEYHLSNKNDIGIFSHNKKAYLILITKNNSFFEKLIDLKELKKQLKTYFFLLKKPFKTKKDIDYFTEKSYYLYNKLFPTNDIKEVIKNKRIIIASNDILSFFPFETLCIKENSLQYLVYNSEINYTYSFDFQQKIKLKKEFPIKNILSIAPILFKYDSLTKLSNSKKEILNLTKYRNSKILLDTVANKTNFIKLCDKYKIIHLATHAKADNNFSELNWIAFQDTKMYQNELYTIKTKADLVVLSACETSLGKVEIGEGVMSLARGFIYSGSKSVVSSLWSINDKATTTIMTDFYKNLKNGQTKSKSLQQAKIHYLKTHSLSEASPYYWAPFVLIGDGDKIDFKTDYTMYYWLFGFLVLGCLVWMYWSLRRRNG